MITLQAGTQGVGPSTEEAAVLLLDRWVGPWGCPHPPPTAGGPKDSGGSEAVWPGHCTCLEGVSDRAGSSL